MGDTSAASFRSWWRPPRKAIDRDPERRVTFLELFYDLVYVVLISEVAHHLAGHVSLEGVGQFAFQFTLLWLAWVNGTLYHEVHGNNDVRTRVFTFLQMAAVAAMAVFADDAFGRGATGFALSFAAFQLVLTYLWWRTGSHDPQHRPLSTPYVVCFLISAGLFVASAFVDPGVRLTLWGLGLGLSVLVPTLSLVVRPRDPEVRAEQERTMAATDSSVERFGLLTIIVLGEVIVGVVSGASEAPELDGAVGATAAASLFVAACLWWLYFDLIAHRLPGDGPLANRIWILLHLLVTGGIAATGAATLNLMEHAGEPLPPEERWLMGGAVALTLLALTGLLWTLRLVLEHRRTVLGATLVLALAATAVVALAAVPLDGLAFMTAMAAVLATPVGVSLWVWITVSGGEEVELN